MSSLSSPALPVTLIRPRRGFAGLQLGELWRFRDLVLLLGMRDIRVRYKQTVLGAGWAILQPLVSMVVLSLVFGGLLGVDKTTGDTPYPVFLYGGLLLWTFFATSVSTMAASLVGGANMLQKVYMPRVALPLASLGAPLIDFAAALVILVGIMAWFSTAPTATFVFLPVFLLVAVLAATGVGLLLAGLTVTYRDFRYVVPFLVQTWFFLTPVVAPVTVVPEGWRWVAALNPMAGTVEGFRACVLGTPLDTGAAAISAATAVACFVGGFLFFNRVERQFADVV